MYFGMIREKTARAALAIALLLAVVAYFTGSKLFGEVAITLIVAGVSGVLLLLALLTMAWLCVGSAKLGQFLDKHESNAKMAGALVLASSIGFGITTFLLH